MIVVRISFYHNWFISIISHLAGWAIIIFLLNEKQAPNEWGALLRIYDEIKKLLLDIYAE